MKSRIIPGGSPRPETSTCPSSAGFMPRA
jgi:hypothetical protein